MLVLSQDGEKIADTSVGYFKYWVNTEISIFEEQLHYEVLFITDNETEVFGAYNSQAGALNAIQDIMQGARMGFKVYDMREES